jgi:molecular chaperone GrpE
MTKTDKKDMDFENKSDDNANMDQAESTGIDIQEPAIDEVAKLSAELQEQKDKFLRLSAEFDNFRKRTARERLDLIQTAGRDVIGSLLEVVDDCDRAEKQLQTSEELGNMKEGILLIFNKLRNILQSKGLKPMQTVGTPFNPDQHEAITEIPAGKDELKGKVVDEVEKGYYLNDKIIRFAKVVVGK